MNDPETPRAEPTDGPTDGLPDETANASRVGPDIDFTDPNSPLARYYFRISHVLATLLLVAIFVFFNLMTPLWHSDVWGHLKIGEWILDHHQLPERELFSPYSDASLPASNFQWLSQILMQGVFRFGEWLAGGSRLHRIEGGVDLLRGLHALAEVLKALFLLLAFRRFASSLPAAIIGVLIVFAFSLAPSAIQRPQVFAEVLFAAILWLMSGPIQGDERLSWRQTVAVVVLLVVWTNTHGSFLLGIALVGVIWMGRTIESLRDHGWNATVFDVSLHRPLIAAALGVVALSLANPHGIHAIPDVLAFAKNLNVLTMQEWKPLDFSTGGGGHWGYLVLLVIVAITQIASPRVFSPTQLVILSVFAVVPLLQERLMTWWVMLAPVVILPTWVAVLPPLPQAWTSVPSLRKTILAVAIGVVAVVWSSFAQLLMGHPPVPIHLSVSQATLWPVTDELLKGLDPESADADRLTAHPLARALKDRLGAYPEGRFQGRIFTPEAMGDFLVWSLPPKAKVMAYSHVHVFPPDYWEDYMEILFARPGWKKVLDRHNVNLIICQVEQRQDLLEKLRDDPDWDIILDQSEVPMNRWYRLFAALRKKPLETLP